MLKTPLQYRWPRAQHIARSGKVMGSEATGFRVAGTQPEPYAVSVEFDRRRLLVGGACNCADFANMSEERARDPSGRGLPLLRGVLVCKHIMAASVKAQADVLGWPVERVLGLLYAY